MIRRRKVAAFAALTAAAALVLSGCSSGGDGDNGGDGGDGGEVIYVEAVGSNPPHLNMALSTDVATRIIATPMFDALIRLDTDYNIYPSLATSWESNEEGTEYTFHLRDDVTWHDGEPFTSADVKFMIEEVLPLHPLGATIAGVTESVETPDDYTVIAHLKEPFAPYVEALASHGIQPKHLYEGTEIATNPVNSAPVGTGPYKFKEFVEGDHITLEKNEDYYAGASNIDTLIFKIMPDANARVLAVQSGEVDALSATFLDAAQVGTLEKDANFTLFNNTTPGAMTLFFNAENGPTADAEVRKALYTAMDRQAIADNAFYGAASPSRGPIPAAITWAASSKVDFNKDYAFDTEKAGEMLDAAGYPAGSDGKRFEINIRTAPFADYVATAESIKSTLESIGVGVNIMAEDLNVFVDQVYTQHNFDMAIMSFGSYEDPSLGTSRLYVCNEASAAFRNPTLMCDAEIDEAFANAATTVDREERAKYFEQAELRSNELMSTVPLVDVESLSLIRNDRWDNIDGFLRTLFFDWSALRAK